MQRYKKNKYFVGHSLYLFEMAIERMVGEIPNLPPPPPRLRRQAAISRLEAAFLHNAPEAYTNITDIANNYDAVLAGMGQPSDPNDQFFTWRVDRALEAFNQLISNSPQGSPQSNEAIQMIATIQTIRRQF